MRVLQLASHGEHARSCVICATSACARAGRVRARRRPVEEPRRAQDGRTRQQRLRVVCSEGLVFEQQDRAAKLMSSEHLTFRKSADGRQLPLQVDDNYLCRSIAALRARARLRRGVPAGPGAPGAPMVTDAQVRLLRKKMAEGKTVMAAAAAAAMSERSAYAWKQKRAA